MKNLLNEIINDLITKKENLNEEINNIIYDDLNKILTVDEILPLEEKRKKIKDIYKLIEYLENSIIKYLD